MTADGAIALIPDEWGVAVGHLADANIERADPDLMADEDFYNAVVVRSHDEEQQTVLARAFLDSGPMRWGGGRRPYFASSQFITNSTQAQQYADRLLPEVSTRSAVKFSIECVADPRYEVGDVVTFDRHGEIVTGRILKRVLPDTGRMSLVVEVRNVTG